MLAGPDLLVVLGIAFVGIGPKKLPELAKTIGKALAEFKKTTEEIKDSIGIKELGGIRSSLTGMDLLSDLAEKVSASMAPKEGPGQTTVPVEVLTPVVNGERLEKGNNDKLDGVREQMPGRGIPS